MYTDNGDEISFGSGDILKNIVPVQDDKWIWTKGNGERGMFPSNYVEVCKNAFSEDMKS
jgi:hypothetical protein